MDRGQTNTADRHGLGEGSHFVWLLIYAAMHTVKTFGASKEKKEVYACMHVRLCANKS